MRDQLRVRPRREPDNFSRSHFDEASSVFREIELRRLEIDSGKLELDRVREVNRREEALNKREYLLRWAQMWERFLFRQE
jgi:hypothetical protein